MISICSSVAVAFDFFPFAPLALARDLDPFGGIGWILADAPL
jgi:hypothetical protein